MAAAWGELLAEGPRQPMQPEAWLDRLIEAELADRKVRSLRYQLKSARFPVHRDLTGIDWAETPLLQAQVQRKRDFRCTGWRVLPVEEVRRAWIVTL